MMVSFVWNNPKSVVNYRVLNEFPIYREQNASLLLAIRTFEDIENNHYFLTVDPHSFQTAIVPKEKLAFRVPPDADGVRYFTEAEKTNTRYWRALMRYTINQPSGYQNKGVTCAEKPESGTAYLTVDLCPSSGAFEKGFFNALIRHKPSPFPVAISLSTLWLEQHPEDFLWLTQQIAEHTLNITWVNHTFSHVYYKDLPLEKNFLLYPGTNVEQELLQNEQALIEQGQVPSIFVRFPGLISDASVMATLQKLGLIPLGAQAWIAKKEPIQAGSIVLVHGNGNEPVGIAMLLPLLADWHWFNILGIFE